VPEDERAEILLEIRSHIADRASTPGAPTTEIFAALGAPQEVARTFLESRRATASPPAQRTAIVTGATASRWTRNVIGGVAEAVAFAFLLLAIMKVLEPHATGFIVNREPAHRFIGLALSDPNYRGRDIFGYWLIPIALGGAALFHLVGSRLRQRAPDRFRQS
jgi:hypothetical protein